MRGGWLNWEPHCRECPTCSYTRGGYLVDAIVWSRQLESLTDSVDLLHGRAELRKLIVSTNLH